MIGFLALLVQAAPAAPVAPLPYPAAKRIELNCTLRGPTDGQIARIAATILPEDPHVTPTSSERSREIAITLGPQGILGKHKYAWLAYRGTYHTVQIQDYDQHTDYLLTLQIPESREPAGAMLYRWHTSGTVSVGYCTHSQDPS